MSNSSIKDSWYATSKRTNGLQKYWNKELKGYVKSQKPSFWKTSRSWFWKLLRRPFCKHKFMIIDIVLSMDGGGVHDGGTLIYHRHCDNCDKKDILQHYVFPHMPIVRSESQVGNGYKRVQYLQ